MNPLTLPPEKREKVLVAIAGILFAVMILPILYYLFWGDTAKMRLQRNRLRTEVEKLENDTANAVNLKKRIDKLTAISLPSGDYVAQSFYQNWLYDQASASELREIKIDQGSISPMKDYYKKYTNTLHCRGSLEQFAKFLELFQRVDHLHLVRKIAVRPLKESREMDISVTVESIALRQAKAAKTSPMNEKSNTVASKSEKEMLRNIVDRAIFSSYVPPTQHHAETPSPKRASFDQSPYCYVTGIVEVNGKPQAWIDIRTESKKYFLSEGEMFRLDGVRCTIDKIDFDNQKVLVKAAGELFTIKVGRSFAEAPELQ